MILGRLVPFVAVASAGALNIFLMHGEETRRGIDIYPVQTEEEKGCKRGDWPRGRKSRQEQEGCCSCDGGDGPKSGAECDAGYGNTTSDSKTRLVQAEAEVLCCLKDSAERYFGLHLRRQS